MIAGSLKLGKEMRRKENTKRSGRSPLLGMGGGRKENWKGNWEDTTREKTNYWTKRLPTDQKEWILENIRTEFNRLELKAEKNERPKLISTDLTP